MVKINNTKNNKRLKHSNGTVDVMRAKIDNFFILLKKPTEMSTSVWIKSLCLLGCQFLKQKWQQFIENILNSRGKKHFLLTFALGFCNFVATVPFSIIIVLPLTFGSLMYIIESKEKETIKSLLITIFAFLFGHFTSIFWWFFVPLTTDFLHLFWLTPFAVLGLPCVMSLLFIPFFWIGLATWRRIISKKPHYLANGTSELILASIFLLSWFCGDYIRVHFIFGGFPWMLFGHFVPYSFAIQPVKIIGIDLYSICFLALVLTPYCLIKKPNKIILKKASFVVIISWIVNCVIGLFITIFASTVKIDADIIASQANIPASLYINSNTAYKIINENARILSILSRSQRPTLMLMPEGSINYDIDSNDALTSQLGHIVPNDNSLLMSGGIHTKGVAPYNVIYAITNGGYIIDMYKKQKLVPFGEYIPFRKFLPRLTRSITGDTFDFTTSGENSLFIFHKNLPIIYPIICYESIFPNYVKKNIAKSRKKINNDLTKEYAKQVNVKTLEERGEIIVNLTNDVWMKWSVGPYQHFLMTRFLAVSTGLPVIRASNNGISAFIDKYGRIKARTRLNAKDILFVRR